MTAVYISVSIRKTQREWHVRQGLITLSQREIRLSVSAWTFPVLATLFGFEYTASGNALQFSDLQTCFQLWPTL